MKEQRQKRKTAVILLLCETAAALLIAWRQGLSSSNSIPLNARYLSDGCFVVGLMVSGIGALIWIASTGFFDMVGYGIQYGIKMLTGIFSANRKPQNKNFYEYKIEKQINREKTIYFVLICGLIFVGLSLIFLKIYYL